MKEIYHRFIRNPRKNVQIKKKKNTMHQKFFPLLTHDFVISQSLGNIANTLQVHCTFLNIKKKEKRKKEGLNPTLLLHTLGVIIELYIIIKN